MNVPLKSLFAASVKLMLVVVIPVPLIWYNPVRFAVPLAPSAYTYTLYPFGCAASPLTVTVVVSPFPVSKYPSIIRAFPGASVIGNNHTLSDFHTTVPVVALPVLSTNANGVELLAPVAAFQFAFATTPATSLAPICVPLPTKSMLMGLAVPPPLPEVTVSATVAVCDSVPLVPVTVTVVGPPRPHSTTLSTSASHSSPA